MCQLFTHNMSQDRFTFFMLGSEDALVWQATAAYGRKSSRFCRQLDEGKLAIGRVLWVRGDLYRHRAYIDVARSLKNERIYAIRRCKKTLT